MPQMGHLVGAVGQMNPPSRPSPAGNGSVSGALLRLPDLENPVCWSGVEAHQSEDAIRRVMLSGAPYEAVGLSRWTDWGKNSGTHAWYVAPSQSKTKTLCLVRSLLRR